ncbi:MAG TPA: M48 family metallopeptidase [bacterium]|nr:M48 family metallopeptidase [bacterium]HPP29612.1 M48 family metallopeptidase [bacterium]
MKCEKIRIENRFVIYKKIYRKIRSARLEFENGTLNVILPENYWNGDTLINQHRRWILKQIERFDEIQKRAKCLTINKNANIITFQNFVNEKISVFARELNVSVSQIKFKKLKSRWGSCSSDGEIIINTILMFLPERYIEYIVFHEVLHRIEKRHNKKFYTLLKDKFPDREIIEKNLSAYWYILSNKKG